MIERYPKRLSVSLSLAAGVLAVSLVANNPGQIQAVLVEAVGLALLVFGSMAYRRHRRLIGATSAVVGAGIALSAVGLGWIRAGGMSAQLELFPGMVGLVFLAVGVSAVQPRWERGFIMAGTAGLLVGVLTSGVVHGAPLASLLGATVATVVAWDTGEQAINLGEQVGSRAVSWSAELAHGVGSAFVGVAAMALAFGVYQFGFQDVPLAGLFLLLVGSFMLTAALYS